MVMQDVSELGTILSIWAHPDDEAYLCGGIMAMATAAASRVVCVTATRGELGVTDPVRWPPEQLAAIREAEMAECMRILGSPTTAGSAIPTAVVEFSSRSSRLKKSRTCSVRSGPTLC